MYGSFELKFLAEQRHEEALQAARTERLAKQARANRPPAALWMGKRQLELGEVLALLRGA